MEAVALTYAQTAEALNISPRTVERMAAAGDLRTVRFGRNVRVPVAEVDRVVADHLDATDPSEAA